MRADGVSVVSIPKSGTHLISEAMHNLDFTLRGVCGAPWSQRERTHMGYWFKRLGLLTQLCNSGSYAWEHTVGPADSAKPPMPAPWTGNKCFVIHELPLDKIDGALYRSWEASDTVKFIFNYRDPRACLNSYVHYLRDDQHMEPAPGQLAYRAILRGLDFQRALDFAIDDPDFPGKQHFLTSAWMLYHPDVLNVRFEDLVESISSPSQMRNTLYRISKHVGAAHSNKSPYSRKALTFRQGTVDGWREDWKPRNLRRYSELYGRLLQTYGYGGDE